MLASSRPRLPLVALLVAALALVLAPAMTSVSSASAKGRPGAAAPAPTDPAPTTQAAPAVTGTTGHPRLGVFTPGAPGDATDLGAFAQAAGTSASVVTFFAAWGTVADFPATDASRIAATGALPELTWEPWHPAKGASQKTYAAARIASGAHDAYVDRWAKQVAAYGKPLRLRFMHEANGDWYPWAVVPGRNTAADHVAAWRRVRSRFAAAGASNVTWVWAPNVPYPGSAPLAPMFPGDAHVDLVGLDGYNFGTSQSWSGWIGPRELFGPGLAELAALSAKPFVIAEVGSSELGGDKAAWIRDFAALLAEQPRIRTATWFHVAKETDWRITSSAAAQEAFRDGFAGLL